MSALDYASRLRTRSMDAREAEAEVRALVIAARAAGITWPLIADSLGITVRTARARFALTEGERRNKVNSRIRAAELRAKAARV